MARKLILEIVADPSKLEKGLRRSEHAVEGFGSAMSSRLKLGFGELVKGTLVVEGVTKALEGMEKAIHAGIEEWQQQQVVAAQTNAVLASTGGIAGVSAGHIEELGKSLMNLSGIDDEVIKAGENVLLSFTNIRNVAGHPIFDEATKSALDFSARTGKDMKQAAIAIGRALQDPAKAAQSLRRAQVSLTGAEKEGIASALKHGDVLKAQEAILAAVERRYGGAAEAAGKTLPGQLAILRENFRNLAGDLLGSVVPAFSNVISGLTDFTKRIGAAQTTHAKLNVVWEGVQDAGRALVDLWRREIEFVVDKVRAVDWGALAQGIGDKLRSIRWGHYIEVVGQTLSTALIDALKGLTRLLNRVPWNQVGRMIIRGLAIAVAAVIKLLASLDWGGIVKAIIGFLVARIRAQVSLFLGIGQELMSMLGKGIQAGADALRVPVERAAYTVVLAFIEPFTHIPDLWKVHIGGTFRSIKKDFQGKLVDLKEQSGKGGEQAGLALVGGFSDGLKSSADAISRTVDDAFGAVTGQVQAQADAAKDAAGGAAAPTLANLASGAGTTTKKPARGPSASDLAQQRNTWFDALVNRQLDILSDQPLRDQIGSLQKVSGLITERIAVTKDITRQLNLEDRLRAVVRQQRGIQAQLKQAADQRQQERLAKQQASRQLELDRLSFQADTAATRSPAAALAALEKLKDVLARRIQTQGATLQLEQQLAETSQKMTDIRAKQRDDAKQRRDDARQAQADRLSFAVERAGATTSLVDDLAALGNQADVLRKLIRQGGDVLQYQRDLFNINQQIASDREQQAETRGAARQARQYRHLGLTAAGEEAAPSVRQLEQQLARVRKGLRGGVLDTKQRRTLLDEIGELLTDPQKWGQIGREMRGKLHELLSGMNDELKKTQKGRPALRNMSPTSILRAAGVNLDPAAARRLEGFLTLATPSGTVSSHQTAAFAHAPGVVNIHGGVHMHGVEDWGRVEDQLAKRSKARAHVRRGS